MLGVAPTMMTPAVAETETHLMSPSLQFFHIFSVVLHTCHVPLMSCGFVASDLTCGRVRARVRVRVRVRLRVQG